MLDGKYVLLPEGYRLLENPLVSILEGGERRIYIICEPVILQRIDILPRHYDRSKLIYQFLYASSKSTGEPTSHIII